MPAAKTTMMQIAMLLTTPCLSTCTVLTMVTAGSCRYCGASRCAAIAGDNSEMWHTAS